MMYRRHAAQQPGKGWRRFAELIGLAQQTARTALDVIMRMGIYEQAQRENRLFTRLTKRARYASNHYSAGLNGPRAMARRWRQNQIIEAKRSLQGEELRMRLAALRVPLVYAGCPAR